MSALAVGGERALAELDAVPAFADGDLERGRQWLRVRAARACALAREEAVLAEVAAWADASGDAEARASLDGWRGRLRYRQGDYDAAAALHARASARSARAPVRIGAALNCASALLEAFRHDEARAWAERARAWSARHRHACYEARAEVWLRALAYRAGEAAAPDRELVEITTRLAVPDVEALLCLNEAAVAWRAGLRGEARELAERARRLWQPRGKWWGALLARALALSCGAPAGEGEEDALGARALACPAPRVGAQALGLLARAGARAPGAWAAAVAAAHAALPEDRRATRLEVLSLDEALAAVRASARED